MNKRPNAVRVRELIGIFLLCLSGVFLSLYMLKIREFEIKDALLLFAFCILSFFGSHLLFAYIKREHVCFLYLILFCELFLRSTVYGRFDFFEYTILEAESERVSFFFDTKVNLMPLSTIGRFFSLSLLSREFIVNVLGNTLILTPIPIALYASTREKKHALAYGVLLTLLLSLTAELLQLFFMCGSPDVDDLILNTLGGVLGAAAVKAVLALKQN